jgi:hypothetical protein
MVSHELLDRSVLQRMKAQHHQPPAGRQYGERLFEAGGQIV